MTTMIRPPRLRAGDRVALVAPAGPVPADKLQIALTRVKVLGLEPVLGRAVRERTGYLAGPDEARAADFQRAIDDPDIAAIWAVRGGYGGMRTLQHVDLAGLADRPRAFIGFSDNTVIHRALARLGLVSFHGPHAGSDAFPPATTQCFRRVLWNAEPAGLLPDPTSGPDPTTLVSGVAEGPLTGGNLAMLAATCGTSWQLDARGRIVVMEDIGEPLYRIDRLLLQLRLAGALDGAAGFAFGRFTDIPGDDERDPSLADVVLSLIAPLRVPAVLGLPIGHADENWTLPLGVPSRLDADARTLTILEPAVT
ncbi:MAG: LD-carboxypeptidase [Gemmatimonadota bacterium]|jgi:muramoyltetrapeptide carboxypeptidase